MKFSKTASDGSTIEMTISNEATLDQVFESFQAFLRGCGYVIEYNQVLDLIDMDED